MKGLYCGKVKTCVKLNLRFYGNQVKISFHERNTFPFSRNTLYAKVKTITDHKTKWSLYNCLALLCSCNASWVCHIHLFSPRYNPHRRLRMKTELSVTQIIHLSLCPKSTIVTVSGLSQVYHSHCSLTPVYPRFTIVTVLCLLFIPNRKRNEKKVAR